MFGTIASLKYDRGFGFILREDGLGQIFFHISGLVGNRQFAELLVGERVSFETVADARSSRDRAVNVVVL